MPSRHPSGGPVLGLLLVLGPLVACAGRPAPATGAHEEILLTPSTPPTVAPAAEPAPDEPTAPSAAQAPEPKAEPSPVRLRDLCRTGSATEEALLDSARRQLEETFCSATLWFDGLLGGEPDVTSARRVSGRVEVSGLYTEFEGFDPKIRLHLRYDLPNLERQVNLFLGRDDEDEVIQDRREGFAIRSSVFGLETEEKWLAGLGYRPPGRRASRFDFRVGARVKSAPEVFAQARWRRNWFRGENTVWRLRETVFWENREGFGSTTSFDMDHVVRRNLVLRWGNVGTFSESTEGLALRSVLVLYHDLGRSNAMAGELFIRGSTDAEVPLREYGARAIFRRPVGKPYLYGSVIAGYSWPQRERDEPREGSALLGIGLELLFGKEPF
ncbi:MAG TPA: hypothetical protein VF017_01465 [Thermoanaerobaculia bacterium]|nr:hypothetical protein [Thermoanaerobaculia bacterium]